MSRGPSDDGIDFKVKPPSQRGSSKPYLGALVILLAVANIILLGVMIAQESRIKELNNQIQILQKQIHELPKR